MSKKRQLSRRDFLRVAASSAAGATVFANVSSALARPSAGTVAQGYEGVIQAFVGSDLQPNQPRGEGLNELTAYRTIADEWEALQSGVTIEFIELPTMAPDQYSIWIKSNQAAGTTPELMWTQDNHTNRDVEGGGSEFWIPLNDVIEQPNPYNSGATKWRDTFVAGYDARGKSVDGNFYMIPQSFSAVQVLVNTTMLDEIGIDRSNLDDWTFDEMLAIADQVKEAGHTPWAAAWNHPTEAWIVTSSLGGFLQASGRFDTLDTNGDGFIEVAERWQAILDGTWAADTPEMRAMWQLAKDWSPHFMSGYLGATTDEAAALFIRGETAFKWDGTWYYPTLKDDPQRTFDFDVVRFPLLNERMATLGESPKAINNYPGGVAGQVALTGTTTDHGNFAESIDFMHYATTVEAASMIAEEHGGIPPAVLGAVGNPELDRFQPRAGETFLTTIHMLSMNFEYGQTYLDTQAAFLSDIMSMDDALAQFQESMNRFAADAMSGS